MDPAIWAIQKAKGLHLPGNWAPRVREIWLRDECKCVYCARDMIENREIAYFFSSMDHLLPVHKYKDLKDQFWNQVLACRNCNGLKGRFDPAKNGIPKDEEHRPELIEHAREYIARRKKELEAVFVVEKQMLEDALASYPKGIGAGA
jgi:HNH endonuclease